MASTTDEICAVCQTGTEDASAEVISLPCDVHHVTHPDCIEPWLEHSPTCPYCRASLVHACGHTLDLEYHKPAKVIDRSVLAESCRPGCQTCVICQERTKDALATFVTLPCAGRHAFHPDCIRHWLEQSPNCPCCRELVAHACGHAPAAEHFQPGTMLDGNLRTEPCQPVCVSALKFPGSREFMSVRYEDSSRRDVLMRVHVREAQRAGEPGLPSSYFQGRRPEVISSRRLHKGPESVLPDILRHTKLVIKNVAAAAAQREAAAVGSAAAAARPPPNAAQNPQQRQHTLESDFGTHVFNVQVASYAVHPSPNAVRVDWRQPQQQQHAPERSAADATATAAIAHPLPIDFHHSPLPRNFRPPVIDIQDVFDDSADNTVYGGDDEPNGEAWMDYPSEEEEKEEEEDDDDDNNVDDTYMRLEDPSIANSESLRLWLSGYR